MKLSFLFLLLVNFKISHAQYIPSALLDAFEAAFIKKDSNLVNLMRLFYPPTQIQPNHVKLVIHDIIVQNITDKNFDYDDPAFVCDHAECRYDGNFLFYDLYTFEEDKSYSKLLTYINSYIFYSNMALFDRLSYRLYATLTLFQPQISNTIYSNVVGISLSIDYLESMPSKYDFYVTMEMALSWVSFL